MFVTDLSASNVRAYLDNALSPELYRDLSDYGASLENGEAGFAGFAESPYWRALKPLIQKKLGEAALVAAFFVRTPPGHSGSCPHKDHGQHSAVLHLGLEWSLRWGGEFFFCRDSQTIDHALEFRPNRLVIWDRDQLHMHRPPTPNSPRDRLVLVMRFEDAV